ILAMALSPDKQASLVAIGGVGAKTGTVTVLDRGSGKIVAQTVLLTRIDDPKNPRKYGDFTGGISSVDFAPDGKHLAVGCGDGSIWEWDFDAHRRLTAALDPCKSLALAFGVDLSECFTTYRRVVRVKSPSQDDPVNRVRLVRYDGPNTL